MIFIKIRYSQTEHQHKDQSMEERDVKIPKDAGKKKM